MPIRTTRWDLPPHTKIKHEILKRYLDAWLPILGSWAGRIVFIDGFAGPGRYSGGELGSPVIALQALLDHPAASTLASFKLRPGLLSPRPGDDRLEGIVSLPGSRLAMDERRGVDVLVSLG